ncbi:hypothetical protein TNCV_2700981 [Trichonephila clavipes]|nr:hypothetical protein TNCV_2700981 [Trichonephila clavipes]
MVMKNAVSGRAKTDLSRLYDELEGKLRALESLDERRKGLRFPAPLAEPPARRSANDGNGNRNHHELS